MKSKDLADALLITGVDTEVGKTVLTSALAAYYQQYHPQRRLGLLKPIQTGEGDRELYTRLFDLQQTPEELNPYCFQAPLAPPLAADRESRLIDLQVLWQALDQLRHQRDFVLVEAMGGLGTPVTWETTVADLAQDWRLPTVLVIPVRLGAIGQTIAHVALARQFKIHLKGLVLNCPQPRTPQDVEDLASPALIRNLTGLPILGTIPHLPDPTDLTALVAVARQLDLEYLFPTSEISKVTPSSLHR